MEKRLSPLAPEFIMLPNVPKKKLHHKINFKEMRERKFKEYKGKGPFYAGAAFENCPPAEALPQPPLEWFF
jgi:hypothetical protein